VDSSNALEDLQATLLVEAAAGSGKTTCLIARMVRLLEQGACEVATLAAVTFTRKAAAELRTRFQLALELAAEKATGEQRPRLQAALLQVERCFIGTIHAFCARLLRERPVEAGLDPSFSELDDSADADLRRTAWREHVSALIATDDPILPELASLGLKLTPSLRRSGSFADELEQLGLEPIQLGPAFLKIAEYPDVVDWPAAPVPLPDLQPAIAALRDYAAHLNSLNLPSEQGNDKLMPRYERLSRMLKAVDIDQPAGLMEVLEQFEPSISVVQKMWPGKKTQALAERDRWESFKATHAQPLLAAWREHRYEPVIRAILPAMKIYDDLRHERNALNFQDLLLRSAALLRSHPEVRGYFAERFTHILVDEFQDTDPIQAEVMLLLTADDPQETNWSHCRPRPGSLFVVGDPKQSIYRFRRADILTYNKVRSIIGAHGQIVSLAANYRSCEPIVNWVNDCFSSIFPPAADDYNPADHPLKVGRTEGTDQPSSVQRLVLPAHLKNKKDFLWHEADVIARAIRHAVDQRTPIVRTASERRRGLPDYLTPGDFLLVSRNKKQLTLYAERLQHAGLPHSVTGGSVLNQTPELELLYVCLAAVVDSDDPLALVAALRSEMFGVADTTLYELAKERRKLSYYLDPTETMAAAEAAELLAIFERFRRYASWLRKLPVDAAIEKIADDLGLIASAVAAPQGDAQAGGLLKAIELIREQGGSRTIHDALELLQRFVENQDHHDGIPVRPPAEAPVRVMNLHQCKGLEAPYVFLVNPSGEVDHPVVLHINRAGDRPQGHLAIYGRQRSKYAKAPFLAHPPGWTAIAAEEKKYLDAEANRLLYVAATRAGVNLVISEREGKNSASPWQAFGPHLQSAPKFADPPGWVAPAGDGSTIDATDSGAAIASIQERWRHAATPTYDVQALKVLALQKGFKPHGAEKDGAAWGSVLHTLLEAIMKRPTLAGADLTGLALTALTDEGLAATLLDELIATVKRVTASDLWSRATASSQCFAEAPLSVLLPAEETVDQQPTILRGVIDLVFQQHDGWVVVDYKSERVGDAELPALVKYYRPQLAAYGDVWAKVTGEKVVERGVFFTHTGKYFSV